jgi:hypothetical protein
MALNYALVFCFFFHFNFNKIPLEFARFEIKKTLYMMIFFYQVQENNLKKNIYLVDDRPPILIWGKLTRKIK